MHLIWENIIKNLILLWTGEFKGLDVGLEDYELGESVWNAVCQAGANSGSFIPSAYGARPPNPATERSMCTADSWSFWTQYLGPVLLHRKFSKPKYYKHFVKLVRMVRVCLQFELSSTDISDLRMGFASWVEEFEVIYYQHNPECLSACPITIHALLHIADSIEETGPVWTSWAFPMERFCGQMQPAIMSRRHPDACMARYIVEHAQLTQAALVHNFTEELTLRPCRLGVIVAGHFKHESYPSCVLLPPRRTTPLTSVTLSRIFKALATRFDVSLALVRQHVKEVYIEQWGKVRRLDGGDTMLAAGLVSSQHDSRDATFVRYETLIDKFARQHHMPPAYEKQTFYGRLEHIFVIRIPHTPALKVDGPTTIFLAALSTCKLESTPSSLSALDIHFYSSLNDTLDIVDIVCLQCLVGRVPMDGGRQWAIIDRSGNLARAVFEDS
ncbi:uncharacterized protein F5891DRAFT_941884 [Suillus fuscotomentosus]|uniref:DUF4218 domain-containing protein n=1 Tax=Suillus fuscotomentosus TaxID=1912939 RepID=A0AAD4HTB2_9AGAM|nr:uncharacterized protein F5891DRAFT_941884 [Suillus fuscotomentosus]KAG1906659.1 hypothetical protein F5891DRAFT_941884 [Suillus fuscotomentosus]